MLFAQLSEAKMNRRSARSIVCCLFCLLSAFPHVSGGSVFDSTDSSESVGEIKLVSNVGADSALGSNILDDSDGLDDRDGSIDTAPFQGMTGFDSNWRYLAEFLSASAVTAENEENSVAGITPSVQQFRCMKLMTLKIQP